MNNTLSPKFSIRTLAQMDTLIRLTIMKTLVTYCPEILPTNQSKDESVNYIVYLEFNYSSIRV